MIYTIIFRNESGVVEEIITMDSISGFDESYSSSVTQHAVESGFSVSDNVTRGNDKFSLSGVITDSRFNDQGAEIQYINGRFVQMYGDLDPAREIPKTRALKERLKKIRTEGEIFGIIVSTSPEFADSQVEIIYPCVLTDLSFSDKDGSNAIYPNMNFEKIRVSIVDFEVVKNPTPDLIPYIKHQNSGNATGASGTVDGAKSATKGASADGDILADAKAQAKELRPDMGDDSAMAKRVKKLDDELQYNKSLIEGEKAARARIDSGAISYGQGGAYAKTYADTHYKYIQEHNK